VEAVLRAKANQRRPGSRISEDPATVTARWESEGVSEVMTTPFIGGKDTEDNPSPRTMSWKLNIDQLSSKKVLHTLQEIMR
jgi:ribulose bisphosphate carboxylase small subunit